MFEIIFKNEGDATSLQQYLDKMNIESWFSETLFQNQNHIVLTLNYSPSNENEQPIVEALSCFIIHHKCYEWVELLLKDVFYYEDPHEIQHILDIYLEMRNGEREELVNLLNKWDESLFVQSNVETLMHSDQAVSFDSFIKFRLKKLQERMMDYVELAIDEYKMEQEYQMFLHMLREYLSSQDHQLNTVHLLSGQYGFRFFDHAFQEITREQLVTMMDKRLLTNHPLYVDSFTIAPLLSIAPNEIHIYQDSKETNLLRTLQNIFEERIHIHSIDEFPQYALYTALHDAVNE